MIQHGVNALKETVRTKDVTLTVDNVAVMVVGVDLDLKSVVEDELAPYIAKVESGSGDDDSDDDDDMGDTGAGAAASKSKSADATKEKMDIDS